MNPLISQVTGRGGSVQEDVPVPCAVLPRTNYRDRLNRLRRRRGEPVDDDGEEGGVSRALGENQKAVNVIPDEAEDLDPMEQSGGTITTRLNPIRDVVQEPTKPKDDDEKFTSPYTALTAPDATPDSLTQTDPSRLPGLTLDKFTAKQAAEGPGAAAAPHEPASDISAPDAGVDSATHTMDVLLGRRRVGSPPSQRKPEEFQGMGAITTEAQALTVLNISPTGAPVSGQALLGQGVEMPAPTASDGKTIFEAARRFR
jgi:hypothetical protein